MQEGFFFFKRCQQNVKRNPCLRFLFDSVRPPRLQFKKMNLMLTIKVQGEVSHNSRQFSICTPMRCAPPFRPNSGGFLVSDHAIIRSALWTPLF